jgi:hypothetical protein
VKVFQIEFQIISNRLLIFFEGNSITTLTGARKWPADHYPMVWDWPAGHNLWNDHQIHGYDVTCRYHPQAEKCGGDADGAASSDDANEELQVLFV